jgi:hypothetical protein
MIDKEAVVRVVRVVEKQSLSWYLPHALHASAMQKPTPIPDAGVRMQIQRLVNDPLFTIHSNSEGEVTFTRRSLHIVGPLETWYCTVQSVWWSRMDRLVDLGFEIKHVFMIVGS